MSAVLKGPSAFSAAHPALKAGLALPSRCARLGLLAFLRYADTQDCIRFDRLRRSFRPFPALNRSRQPSSCTRRACSTSRAAKSSLRPRFWSKDDRIAGVGPGVSAPAGTQVIDLGDVTLMPGLIDAHVHLFLHPGAEDLQTVEESVPQRTILATLAAKADLMAGFTAERDMGTEGAGSADTRRAQRHQRRTDSRAAPACQRQRRRHSRRTRGRQPLQSRATCAVERRRRQQLRADSSK